MKRKVAAVFVFAVFAVLVLHTSPGMAATVPQLMNYQGRLNDNLGSAVTGTRSMTFSLYSDLTTTTCLWSEIQNNVAVKNGVFNILLGSSTPLPANVFDNAEVWLGIKVDADPEMAPRQRITSVGYAMRAGCNPGDMLTCYTADPATLPANVLPAGYQCKTGTRTCLSNGSGYGACAGEVVPNCGANCVDLQNDQNNCGACGHACEAAQLCTSGVCESVCGDCNDGIACTVDVCDAQARMCFHTPVNELCDDGIYCNGVEMCDFTGCIPGLPVTCPDDGIACTMDACDEAVKACTHTPLDELCAPGTVCQISSGGCQ